MKDLYKIQYEINLIYKIGIRFKTHIEIKKNKFIF